MSDCILIQMIIVDPFSGLTGVGREGKMTTALSNNLNELDMLLQVSSKTIPNQTDKTMSSKQKQNQSN